MEARKIFKLSLISAACLSAMTVAQAGQITGVTSGAAYTSAGSPPTAFAIGGWDLVNVSPMITDVETGDEIAKTFDPTTGTYTPMEVGDTFKSIVFEDENKTEATGSVHGKDWPVGEPHGIKVANSAGPMDLQNNEKPASCILSTSFYLNSDDPKNYVDDVYQPPEGDVADAEDQGWLNSTDEAYVNPTYCDSPFQTHKRFKVDALTPAVDGDPAKPVDLVFNVEAGETAVREYMVLQKLNNYSVNQYGGVRVEVGFGIGAEFVNAATVANVDQNLKLSYTAGAADEYTFDAEDRANFSAGLFGTADNKHPNDGFFDTRTAGYEMAVDAAGTTIESTGLLPSNYTAIYGDWLPVTLEPQGLFFDDDNDPLTDAALIAYEGPSPTDNTVTWRNGNEPVTLNIDTNGDTVNEEYVIGSFEAFPQDVIDYYQALADSNEGDGLLYEVGGIEDLLNLGLTYIVEVGDVATFPAEANNTFTIRLKPLLPAEVDYDVPDSSTGTTSSSSGGGSASTMSMTSLIIALLVMLGLGGWLASRKK